MNYHLKSSTRGKREYAPAVYILVFFTVVVFSINALAPTFFPAVFSFVMYPIYKSEQSFVNSTQLLAVSKEELSKENEELKQKIRELENEQQSLTLYIQENNELKEIFGRSAVRDAVLAVVLQKPPISLYDTLVLDIGRSANINVGDRVYVDGDILLGKIVEVNNKTSKVKLYSTPGEKFEVEIGENHIQATATGRGNGNFEVTLPREVEIKEGDTVVIPSITPTLFATVSSVSGDPARAFQLILFKTPINIQEIGWVLVERMK